MITGARLARIGFGACAIVLLAGCATAPHEPGASSGSRRQIVTEEQLARVRDLSAFDALHVLRPAWVTRRGSGSIQNPNADYVRVYVDNLLRGDVQVLRGIAVTDIQSIEYLDSRQATLRYGTNNVGGAILVTTRH